jgi:hypothetical protein
MVGPGGMSWSKNINGLKWRTTTNALIDPKSVSGAVANLPALMPQRDRFEPASLIAALRRSIARPTGSSQESGVSGGEARRRERLIGGVVTKRGSKRASVAKTERLLHGIST